MKQSPLERRTPLAARSALATTKGLQRKRAPRVKPRKSEAWFREGVLRACGAACRVCGTSRWIQAAHIWGKGQGGPTVVENGIPLCREHHEAYDQYRLQLSWGQLGAAHVAWLAKVGYVAWDADGQPYGRGCRRFAPMTTEQVARRKDGGHHEHDD